MADTPLPQRDPNGRLVPGTASLNPGGRPKVVAKIQELARQHTETAIARIVELASSADERIALAAATELLDRGFGRPVQATQSTVEKVDYSAVWLAGMKEANAAMKGDGAKVVEACRTTEVREDGAASGPEVEPEIVSAPADAIAW
jgi:hypothetical protein